MHRSCFLLIHLKRLQTEEAGESTVDSTETHEGHVLFLLCEYLFPSDDINTVLDSIELLALKVVDGG